MSSGADGIPKNDPPTVTNAVAAEGGAMPVERLSGERAKREFRARMELAAAVGAIIRLTLRRSGAKDVAAPDVPPWVTRCFDMIAGTVLTNMPVDQDETIEPGPKDKGFYVGLVRWLENWITERVLPLRRKSRLVLPEPMEQKAEAAWKSALVVEEIMTEKELSELIKEVESQPDLSAELEGSTLTDARDFTEGLLHGMRGLSGTPDGSLKCTDATDIYYVVILFWQHVQRMQSSAQLHAWLTRIGGTNRIGDKKRIEQLCRRIGLRFRGRGRPPKFYAKLKG
jgi:hypothetical protein